MSISRLRTTTWNSKLSWPKSRDWGDPKMLYNTWAATFPAQHTTIGIGIRSSCCSFLATQTMVCSKMKDKIWQKARDKKHFIRDEIYWWQRERTLVGHAHILWVLLSAARIAVRALNCITYHVAEPVGVWNGLCAPASKPSNLLNSCVFILDAL